MANKPKQTPVKPASTSKPGLIKTAQSAQKTPFDDWGMGQATKPSESYRNYVPPPPQESGGKIICTRWYELGYMDEETYRADQAYGRWLIEHEREAMVGYLAYAPYIVRCMGNKTWQSKLFIKALGLLVNPWAKAMSHFMGVHPTGSRFGALVMKGAFAVFLGLSKYRAFKLRTAHLFNKHYPEGLAVFKENQATQLIAEHLNVKAVKEAG
jgi:hypothetical protein